MALPLPRVVPDVGPGGGVVTAMRGMNALSNDLLERQINQIKAQYAPLTAQAEAASKLAYANLMGPQFLTKLLGNENALGNLSENQKREILNKVYGAGTGQGFGANALAQMQGQDQKPEGFGGFLKNALRNMFGGQQQPGMQAQGIMPQQQAAQAFGAPQQRVPMEVPNAAPEARPPGAVSKEGEQWYDQSGNPVYAEQPQPQAEPMELELTQGIPPKTYAEKAGEFKGTIKQKEEEGKYRADALNKIGESQRAQNNAGTVIDRMTEIVQNPLFANLRKTIPFFQDKQLSALSKIGSPEEQEIIGDFLSTAESLISATAQSMGGSSPLVREYELAQKQKLNPSDTIDVALGKLRSSTALHDIAYQKNKVVSELLQKGYNETEAINMANKMIDVKAIEKETKDRLSRKIEIRNAKTGEKKTVTIEEARRLGVPNV